MGTRNPRRYPRSFRIRVRQTTVASCYGRKEWCPESWPDHVVPKITLYTTTCRRRTAPSSTPSMSAFNRPRLQRQRRQCARQCAAPRLLHAAAFPRGTARSGAAASCAAQSGRRRRSDGPTRRRNVCQKRSTQSDRMHPCGHKSAPLIKISLPAQSRPHRLWFSPLWARPLHYC